MSRTWSNPLQRVGIVPTTDRGLRTPAAAGSATAAGEDTARSPLVDLYADLKLVHGHAPQEITVPAGTYSPSACYPLIDVPIDQFGQDMLFFRAWADLASCDAVPADPVTYGAWGFRDGSGAAVVVGTDLFPAGTTTFAAVRCPVGGVEMGGLRSIVNNVIWWSAFPSGNKSDTVPNTRRPADSTSPQARRLLLGQRLQAAVWIRGAHVQAAIGKIIAIKASVGVWLAETHTVQRLRSGV